MTAPRAVQELVDRYSRNRGSYEAQQYNEAQLRHEFLDPLFGALGWDVNNEQGYAEPYKDVVHEYSLRTAEGIKAPDYSFRVGGTRKFFVEAKKPSVNVGEDPRPAFQLRRYAWSAALSLSVVSNFKEFAVYDCLQEPTKRDTATTARTLYVQVEALVDRWDEIAAIFSKESVLRGSFDSYALDNVSRRGSAQVDDVFLRSMQAWRKALAEHLASKNPGLRQRQLNYAVQQTLDRIVFLRICEDRGIEPYGRLQELLEGKDLYRRLCGIFRAADDRYNSGLFHFKAEQGRDDPDTLTLGLTIEDKPLKDILRHLYYTDSPYAFGVLPPDILGQVYEQFLGQVITLTPAHKARVEDKPEVKKAGGVFYTPSRIVHRIVAETLNPLLEGKTPTVLARKKAALRIVDPACGSGSFLLSAYQYLLEWHLAWYLQDSPERWSKSKPPRLRAGTAENEWLLTTAERKRILLTHVFGVDIDAQAVEVTKLSLVLKVLEGESGETLHQQLLLFHERALPDLSHNVKCGNSLVPPDFYDSQLSLLTTDDQLAVNAFSWTQEFHEVMAAGGFQAVVGNPPWLMAGYYIKNTLEYLKTHYESAEGKFDLYYLFVEQGCRLLAKGGCFGMIIPNKFFHTEAAGALRDMLSKDRWTRKVVDFGHEKVFKRATNYSCLLFLEKGVPGPVEYERATAGQGRLRAFTVPRKELSRGPWHFLDSTTRRLFSRLEGECTPLEEMVARFGTGVQSGADKILTFDTSEAQELHLEPLLLRPMLRGRDVRRFRINDSPKLLLFPYREDADGFVPIRPSELRQFPVADKYLRGYRAALQERTWFGKSATDQSGQWYGMMYLEPLSSLKAPHLLTPSLSGRPNFSLGPALLFATGTAGVTSVIPLDEVREDLKYLLGLLNSTLLGAYAISHSPVYSGGYYKFSAPYLKALPIRRIRWDDEVDRGLHEEVVRLVQRCLDLRSGLDKADDAHERTALKRQIDASEEKLDATVNGLYGLSESEVAKIHAILEQDAGPSEVASADESSLT